MIETLTLTPAATTTETERRLALAYAVLIGLADEKTETTGESDLCPAASPVAGDACPTGQDARSIIA